MDAERRRSWYAVLSCATIAFALLFVYPAFAPLAVPWYYPVERTWAWEVAPDGLAMDFYGRVVVGTLAALAAGAVAAVVLRLTRPPGERVVNLLTAWSLTAILLAALHFAWTLYGRVPVPVALPDWYVPR